jgi:A/G-specific adenine glycosylase
VPAARPGDFNQGLMEIGAEVCTPRDPRCDLCTLAPECVAKKTGQVLALPVRAPRRKKKDKPLIVRHALWVEQGEQLLFGQRPARGLYGGLWEMPQADSKKDLGDWFGQTCEIIDRRPVFRHEQELTHRQLQIDVWRGRLVRRRLPAPAPYLTIGWHDKGAAADLGLSSATRSILSKMKTRRA